MHMLLNKQATRGATRHVKQGVEVVMLMLQAALVWASCYAVAWRVH